VVLSVGGERLSRLRRKLRLCRCVREWSVNGCGVECGESAPLNVEKVVSVGVVWMWTFW
jgi:hypothetical protein